MRKIITILGMCTLLLLIGCTKEEKCCCCNDCCNNEYPTLYNTYVVCDTQEIWDMRGNIPDFNCECDNIGCRNFPSKRVCTAGLWVKNGSKMEYVKETITCTEVIGKDRRCN